MPDPHITRAPKAATGHDPAISPELQAVVDRMSSLDSIPVQAQLIEMVTNLNGQLAGFIEYGNSLLKKKPGELSATDKRFISNLANLHEIGAEFASNLVGLMERTYEAIVLHTSHDDSLERDLHDLESSHQLLEDLADTLSIWVDGEQVAQAYAAIAKKVAEFAFKIDEDRIGDKTFENLVISAINLLALESEADNLDLSQKLFLRGNLDPDFLESYAKSLSPQALKEALDKLWQELKKDALAEDASEADEDVAAALEQLVAHRLKDILPILRIKLEKSGRLSGSDEEKTSCLVIISLRGEDLDREHKDRAYEAALPYLNHSDVGLQLSAIRAIGAVGRTMAARNALRPLLNSYDDEIALYAGESYGMICERIIAERAAEAEAEEEAQEE